MGWNRISGAHFEVLIAEEGAATRMMLREALEVLAGIRKFRNANDVMICCCNCLNEWVLSEESF